MPPRTTPRRTRQRHQVANFNPPVQASDYDSEVFYQEPPQQERTREQINHEVLKRYVPSLHQIIDVAPGTVAYIWDTPNNSWTRADVEGAMFVCQLTDSPVTGGLRHCIVVLNRKGLDNLIVESGEIVDVEVNEGLLTLRFRPNQTEEDRTLGLHILGDDHTSKEHIWSLVKAHWALAMEERKEVGQVEYDEEVLQSIEAAPEDRVMGRRISLTDLFGRRGEATGDEDEDYYLR